MTRSVKYSSWSDHCHGPYSYSFILRNERQGTCCCLASLRTMAFIFFFLLPRHPWQILPMTRYYIILHFVLQFEKKNKDEHDLLPVKGNFQLQWWQPLPAPPNFSGKYDLAGSEFKIWPSNYDLEVNNFHSYLRGRAGEETIWAIPPLPPPKKRNEWR